MQITKSMQRAIDTWDENSAHAEVRSSGEELDAAREAGRGVERLERRYEEALEIELQIMMRGSLKP